MRHREQGFTLIEVMVVIIMIGVLAAVAIPIYSGYVFRARASEGITTLGAVKTYALEHRTSQGEWPTIEELKAEFHNFNELYYFNQSVTVIESGDRYAVRITANDNFALPEEFEDDYIQLDFAISEVPSTQRGWSGGIFKEYAQYLKAQECELPLS